MLTMRALLIVFILSSSAAIYGQGNNPLTPMQQRIEQQRLRLGSADAEERRDALMKLGSLKHRDASKAAATSLNDADPMVRATAAHAITALPANEAAGLLLPLLKDKSEFLRREIVAALGETRSESALQPLVELLTREKEPSVRAAAVLALGEIANEMAVPALAQVLSGLSPNKKSKKREDDFVMRAAAQALGQIGSRAGVMPLVTALANETGSLDLRRAAADSLGLIGDATATPALEAALTSSDPYLVQAAQSALRRIRIAKR